jgi:hypothetical protein
MRGIFAIARLAGYSALHSRIFGWMLGGILAAVLLLPYGLHGDATPDGQVRMMIAYPLAISFAILVLGTLWMSSGLVASEIDGGQLQSVVVKPVRGGSIWFGKWLALLAINSILVLVMGAGILISVRVYFGGVTDSEAAIIRQRVLTARRAFAVDDIPNLDEKAEAVRRGLISQGVIDSDVGLDRIRGEIKAERSMAFAGREVSWPVTIPKAGASVESHRSVALRYRFGCAPSERIPIAGIWTVSGDVGSDPVVISVSNIVDGTHHMMLPAGFSPTGGVLKVSFRSSAASPTLYFNADSPVEIMVYSGGFILNLLRGMIALVCFLAGIAAVGLTMSSMFSFPVAAFCSVSIIFAISLASSFSEGIVGHNHGGDSGANRLVELTEPVILFLKHATANVTSNLPLDSIAGGMLFSWHQVAECVVTLLVLLPLVLGIAASAILAQKEFAA